MAEVDFTFKMESSACYGERACGWDRVAVALSDAQVRVVRLAFESRVNLVFTLLVDMARGGFRHV